jgi:hypothetical protein
VAAKSVVQVEVDSSQFADFYSLFQEYQAKLETMPDDWKATGEAINDAGGGMDAFSEASRDSKDFLLIAATQAEVISKEIHAASASNNALLESLTKNIKAQKDFADETERGNQSLKKMKDNAEGVASSIFGIGKFLMKVGVWGAGLAGLGGLLGGLGLKDLAESAVDNQRSARGLGMTPGQLTAFNQDYGRYIDQGTLGSIADAQNSYAGQMWLARASGLNTKQVIGEDPGQLAGQLAIRAHDWWVNTPENMRTAENLQSSGFTQSGFSLAMMRQFGNTPLSELQRAGSQYQQDQGKLNVGDKNTDAWYGFLRQITDAGNTIEKDLTNRLSALAPDLQHFVDVMGKDAKKLIDEIFTPSNLQSLENGIDKFADYLGSQQFQQDMKTFAGLIGLVADKLRSAAKFLGIDTGPALGSGGSLDPNEVQRETHGLVTDFSSASNSTAAQYQALSPTFADNLAGTVQKMGGEPGYFGAFEKSQGLPAGLLWAQEYQELGGKMGNIGAISPKGAMGPFQFEPDTAKQYGLQDPFNLHDSSAAAARMMGDLMRKYKGDVRKALAAYNWGSGNVDKDISKNGANWESNLPAETRNYLNKIAAALAKRGPNNLNVTVTNNTSARVAVQANAAAAQ